MTSPVRWLPEPAFQFLRRVKRRVLWEWQKPRLHRRLAQRPALPVPGKDKGIVLFFAPEAGVTPHVAALCVLARILQERGHTVCMTRCFQCFSRCPVMTMQQLPFAAPSAVKRPICLHCASDSLKMLDAYGLPHLDLRSFLTEQMTADVARALQEAPEDLRQFTFDSVPFGQLCILDMALNAKIYDFGQVGAELRSGWLQFIETSVLAYLLVDRICQQVPVTSLAHYDNYGIMLGARLAAAKHGIPSYGVNQAGHNNIDRRLYVLLPEIRKAVTMHLRLAWPDWRALALSPGRVGEITDDLITRFRAHGSHRFSPAKTFTQGDIRSSLGLADDRKLLVAYTSSLDENLAGWAIMKGMGYPPANAPQPFADQVEWLQALTRFVEASDDLQLVVRIHPREGKTKGAKTSSQHLQRLLEAFDRPFQQCRFVWPEQPVSSYDLAEAADLVLTSWSTVGSEVARAGVPVLTATQGLTGFPQDDFLEWGATPDEYFCQLRRLLERPVTLEQIGRAFRWYNLFHLATSIDLSDIIPDSQFAGLPPFSTPREARAVEQVLVEGADILAINHARLQDAQQDGGNVLEAQVLQRHLRRIIHLVYTGQDEASDAALDFAGGAQCPDTLWQEPLSGHDVQRRRLLARGGLTQYWDGGTLYSKYSPLCARLGPLCATSLVLGDANASSCVS